MQIAMSTLVLENVAWSTYQRHRHDILKHEAPKRLLETLVELWCEEREIPFLPLGSTTYADAESQRGGEPDSGFVFGERAEIVADYTEGETAEALHPDLAIEVDITSPSVGKDGLYFRIGVAEVWRWRSDALTILRRGEEGFAAAASSQLLPGIDAKTLTERVLDGQRTTQLAWRRGVRAWARSASGGQRG